MNHTDQLIEKFLDGGLTVAEREELKRVLEADAPSADSFFAYYQQARLIEIIQRPAAPNAVEAIIAALSEEDPFVNSVMAEARACALEQSRSPAPDRQSRCEAMMEWLRNWRSVLSWAGATAGIVVVVLGCFWFLGPAVGEPILAELRGSEISIERGTEMIPASAGTHLQPADVLRTPTNATAAITFGPEKTKVALSPETELRLASLKSGKRFELRRGKIDASVARQRPFRGLIITTPNAEARVLGTRFSLAVMTNSTRLDVEEGKVRLTRAGDGARINVPANHYAVAAANSKLAALPQTGWIFREYWTNLPGGFQLNLIVHPAFSGRPHGLEWVSRLETTNGWGRNYAARWRGYLHPPMSGEYRLGLAAADGAILYLSPNDRPEGAFSVGQPMGPSLDHWNPDRDGPLGRVNLIAGRRYYIEALHKAGKGEDRLAVAWKRPDGKIEIISGDYLSPFKPKPKDVK